MTAEEVKEGMAVHYHPIIGGKHDGREYTVVRVGNLFGRPVAWLAGKSGCVTTDALSPFFDAPEPKPETEDTQE